MKLFRKNHDDVEIICSLRAPGKQSIDFIFVVSPEDWERQERVYTYLERALTDILANYPNLIPTRERQGTDEH